ncbi:MAG: hypothetical protein IKG17_08860 [Mogibacterium sp.]|nr:hypothetical protein [Mogibacterium sp.]
MNAELKHRLNYEILMLERTRKEYVSRLERLENYKGSFLRRKNHGHGKYYYFIKRHGSKAYKYIGDSDKREVKMVREARFLEESIRRIDRDLGLMKALADDFLPFDPSHISESLPKTYRCDVPPVSELYQREGAEWKAAQLDYQKRFPENYPERKTQRTSDGVMVKSISEVVLYEMFKSAGLVQVYELPFPPMDYGPTIYPDFTILSPVDMKTNIIVEYVGRMDLTVYGEKFAKRVKRYMDSGYQPGVNLFFIFGDKKGNIDSTQVAKVIADIFGLRSVQTF